MVQISVKTNTAKFNAWGKTTKLNAQTALRMMGQEILNTSKVLAPKKDGTLRRTGTVKTIPDGVQIRYGDGIKYAMYQERGMRADGSHIVRNYTTPGTGAHYLERTSKNVIKNGIKRYMR